jgi:hypothetical protein
MADNRDEAKFVVSGMLTNMKAIALKDPKAPIGSSFQEFNSVLRQAKKAFPESTTIREMQELPGSISAADVVMKLSALDGAMGAAS